MDSILIMTVISAVIFVQWKPLALQFPPRKFIEPTYRRRFQSFQVGALGLGFSIHVVLDDECLHLVPIRFLRWFGCDPISIPWASVQILKLFPRQARVRIGKTNVVAPRWCIEPRLRFQETDTSVDVSVKQ